MNPNIIPLHNDNDDCNLVKAIVKGLSNKTLMIQIDAGVINARVAFSCLVAPEVGDIVLVNQSANDFHVLAILERATGQDMTLKFPSNVKMVAADGQFDLVSNKNINVISAANTRMVSKNLNITASNIDINAAKLSTRTKDIESHSQSIKLYTNILDTVAKQVTQKTDTLIRWVENVETLSIGNLIQNVRKNLVSHSTQAVITAKKDMRIDAERIHMG